MSFQAYLGIIWLFDKTVKRKRDLMCLMYTLCHISELDLKMGFSFGQYKYFNYTKSLCCLKRSHSIIIKTCR